jgi:hypothetical protein
VFNVSARLSFSFLLNLLLQIRAFGFELFDLLCDWNFQLLPLRLHFNNLFLRLSVVFEADALAELSFFRQKLSIHLLKLLHFFFEVLEVMIHHVAFKLLVFLPIVFQNGQQFLLLMFLEFSLSLE